MFDSIFIDSIFTSATGGVMGWQGALFGNGNFSFFPSHLIVRHFIHLIHFILFTSLKSKHPVRRCLGTCLTHSKTGRRDWNIRVHSFSLISCSFASVSFTSFSFTSVSFTSFFFISFTNTKRLEKTKNSLVGVVVVGADG